MAANVDMDELTIAGRDLLGIYDNFMSGKSGGDSEPAKRLFLAASYGAQAYQQCPDPNAAPSAMLRALLLAMIDPLHPDLDCLRRDPAAGESARVARKAGAM